MTDTITVYTLIIKCTDQIYHICPNIKPKWTMHFNFLTTCFLSSTDFFSNLLFQQNSFRNTIRVPDSLDPDQAPCPMVPNCLQKLSADDTGWQELKFFIT